MSPFEVFANVSLVLSILLAARNSIHTWWTGIVACATLGWIFYEAKLYAEVVLQGFFIATSAGGWWNWLHGGREGQEKPIRRTPLRWLMTCVGLAGFATMLYGTMLHRFTDAWAPFFDSAVLMFSVLAQLLLMGRRIENWPCWVVVNTISVPLYYSRELYLTSGLYVLFWLNAIYAFFHWRRFMREQRET